MYRIKNYSREQARNLGVVIKPSTNPKKKIDVFKNGVKVASIGAYGMKDYPTYKELERTGQVERGTAEKRRKAYKSRHSKDRNVVGSNGYYADRILW